MSPSASSPVCLCSDIIFDLLPIPICWHCTIIFAPFSIFYDFLFWDKSTVLKTSVLSYAALTANWTLRNVFFCWMSLLQNVITVTTVLLHPSPRYYHEISPVPAVITVVTAVLPLSPLPCHPMIHAALLSHWSNKNTFSNCLKQLYGKSGCLRSVSI